MTTLTPTREQRDALGLFETGESLAIEAGAGTGKTSTLRLLAGSTTRRGQYLAFNKAIVLDAAGSFPENVACNTAHSLAYRAIGRRYRDRLNAPRQRNDDIARILGIRAFEISTPAGKKRLGPGYLAGLVMRATTVFCSTADPEPEARHFPYVEGIDLPLPGGERGWTNNLALRNALTPALLAAWGDLQRDDDGFLLADTKRVGPQRPGLLRFGHEVYLKLWQLNGPRIPADYILFDECQPPDTLVELAGGRGHVRIADLAEGDRVVSYTKGRVMSSRQGSVVLGKSVRPHRGELVVVAAAGRTTRYTPNHIAMARIGAAFEGRTILYLMRQGDRWRIGVTQGRHGSGPGRTTGLMGRLREERGDAAWVLEVFESRAEAEAAEQHHSLVWRIPQARFTGDGKFWNGWDTTYSDPDGCLAHFGRLRQYPLVGPERRYMLGDRFTETRACNLMDGMEVMSRDQELHPAQVWREPYDGPVVSLTVSGPATYVADGIVTHNCQDANPVMLDIVRQQVHAQLVFVGDSCQAIYGFTGAKNALREVPAENRTYLSQSFRFGPAIAEVANAVLDRLGADLRLRGLDSIPSTTGPLAAPDAILTRTNAAAVEAVLDALGRGQRPALVGGADDVIRFAEAASQLQDTGSTWHPELACFGSWGEVVAYVADDANGGDLALLVRLVEDFGPQRIVAALRRTCREDGADVVISTAHKSKGREWDRVQLADDFPDFDEGPDPEEFRLLYVAVTRARVQLDYVRVPSLRALLRPAASTR